MDLVDHDHAKPEITQQGNHSDFEGGNALCADAQRRCRRADRREDMQIEPPFVRSGRRLQQEQWGVGYARGRVIFRRVSAREVPGDHRLADARSTMDEKAWHPGLPRRVDQALQPVQHPLYAGKADPDVRLNEGDTTVLPSSPFRS